jgi:hypothetical protein
MKIGLKKDSRIFGTRLVISPVVSEAVNASQSLQPRRRRKPVMKAVNTKMLVSLVGVLLAAPFFFVALVVGARAVSLSQGSQDNLLLVALVMGGAAIGVVNGMGRRAQGETGKCAQAEAAGKAASHGASVIHLGY